MILEEKIQEIIEEYNLISREEDTDNHTYLPIINWHFLPESPEEMEQIELFEAPTIRRIHNLIRNASLEICLTSPSSYIREFKLWSLEE